MLRIGYAPLLTTESPTDETDMHATVHGVSRNAYTAEMVNVAPRWQQPQPAVQQTEHGVVIPMTIVPVSANPVTHVSFV